MLESRVAPRLRAGLCALTRRVRMLVASAVDVKNRIQMLVALLLTTGLLGVWVVFRVMHFDALTSDVLGYWTDSLNWRIPLNPFHAPGYPLLIAGARFLSGALLPPLLYMQLIAALGLIICMLMVWRLARVLSGSDEVSWLILLAFALWPMEGLTSVVFPLADSLALALFLSGLWWFYNSRIRAGAAAWALGLVVHKAIWPFVGLCFLAWALKYVRTSPRRVMGAAAVTVIPLLVLWICGALYHHSVLWIVSGNAHSEMDIRFFSGLVGALRSGGLTASMKGSILVGVFFTALLCMAGALCVEYPGRSYGVAIAGSVLLLTLILNTREIWASVRFGRLLVLPLSGVLGALRFERAARLWPVRIVLWGCLLCLYASQFVFAWYIVAYYS